MSDYIDREFLYTGNVELSERVSLEMVCAELKDRCGDDAKVGPAWDESQRRFVEARGVIGIYVRDCAGSYSLEHALREARRQRPSVR